MRVRSALVANEDTVVKICNYANEFTPDELELVSVLIIEDKPVTEEVIYDLNPYNQIGMQSSGFNRGCRTMCEYLGVEIKEG